MFVPISCRADEWTSSNQDDFETPVRHDKLHYGFDKTVSDGKKRGGEEERRELKST